MEKSITIIIPFRNEGDELVKTIRSLDKHCPTGLFDIICIDDDSDDGVDYRTALEEFGHVRYIRNSVRKGVAGSRDTGAEAAEPPYILLLDAHMRVSEDVITPLIGYLEQEPRTLFCLQSRIMKKRNDTVLLSKGVPVSRGAAILFDDSNMTGFLNVAWEFLEMEDYLADKIDIPMVLGAAYAMSRDYYIYLHGLNGLAVYGGDEAFLSTKVWLEGGRCALLRELEAGHIYRDTSPCGISNNVPVWYNKMVYAELLLPDKLRDKFRSHLKTTGLHTHFDRILDNVRKEFKQEREYLQGIFTRDFETIINLNADKDVRKYPR